MVYLRNLGGPARAAAGLSAREIFPLMRLDQLPPLLTTLLRIEVGREASTLIMIAAAAGMVSGGFRNWLGAFVLAFGVWDLSFYAWLRVLIGWPGSLMSWDLLFLLPVPWAAPVLAPAIVAATMAVFGAWMLVKEPRGKAKYAGRAMSAGAAILFLSFIWDWPGLMSGAMPHSFPWMIFALGEAGIIAGFLLYLRKSGDNIRA